jgi:2-phospho-L-lactate guanylyltransferase
MGQLVIAVRGGPDAKSRCADMLAPADRAELTVLMLEDMLSAAARTAGLGRTWVVTPTPRVAEAANALGASTILQPEPADLNGAFELALAVVGDHAPYDAIALLPGDLPLLQPSDLEAALALARTHAVVLARTRDGGTGAIVLQPGARPPLAFGADSFARHVAAARALDLSVATLDAASLAHDVDEPADLAAVLDQGPATRTAVFLRRRLQTKISS